MLNFLKIEISFKNECLVLTIIVDDISRFYGIKFIITGLL